MKYKLASAFVLFSYFMLLTSYLEAKLPTTTVIASPGVKVEAELAYTDETRSRGLMFVESLPQDAGMLFVFPNLEPQGFWMKNTLIPLDMIWMNERKEIVYFLTAEPCKSDPCESYEPMQKAKYVLEVNAGFVKKHHLQIGNRMEFTLPADVERVTSKRIGF
jgi:uncharacterized membrane protein (UPF0127 family)